MRSKLTLVSHALCPYVQRAVIALSEKGVPFERIDIDLANKPDWFLKLSPFGKTPILVVDEKAIFESAVIVEYLEETQANPLHPADALKRAEHRGWIEFSSSVLSDIAGFYTARDESVFEAKRRQLAGRFAQLEQRLVARPWFDGATFSVVDASFGPVFRYCDRFEAIGEFGLLTGLEKIARWRASLAARPSIINAVQPDYPARLRDFIARRGSHLATLQANEGAA